jgi:hypothetical protein
LIADVKRQLNKPFAMHHTTWDAKTQTMVRKEQQYSNPVFAFHNIYNYRQAGISDDVYYNQEDKKRDFTKTSDQIIADIAEELATGNNWYDWNTRNWGTKWDVAVQDGDEYPETELTDESEDSLSYHFNTAWCPPIEAITKLSEQYPSLEIELTYEEETGWGGTYVFLDGDATEVESYENKCRDCESLNTMEYCDNDCGEICSDCNWLGEADLDCVAECDVHKVYLDDNHLPEYRRVEA